MPAGLDVIMNGVDTVIVRVRKCFESVLVAHDCRFVVIVNTRVVRDDGLYHVPLVHWCPNGDAHDVFLHVVDELFRKPVGSKYFAYPRDEDYLHQGNCPEHLIQYAVPFIRDVMNTYENSLYVL